MTSIPFTASIPLWCNSVSFFSPLPLPPRLSLTTTRASTPPQCPPPSRPVRLSAPWRREQSGLSLNALSSLMIAASASSQRDSSGCTTPSHLRRRRLRVSVPSCSTPSRGAHRLSRFERESHTIGGLPRGACPYLAGHGRRQHQVCLCDPAPRRRK